MWKKTEFLQVKANMAAELQQKLAQLSVDDVLASHLIAIGQLKDSPAEGMRVFILIMQSLNLHLNQGGLKPTQIRDLLELAEVILTVAGIKPKNSVMSWLYGDIHLVLSQLHTLEGQALLASWEQQIAIHFAGTQAPGGWDLQLLNSGVQSLRLGHGSIAVEQLREVFLKSVQDKLKINAGINLLRTYRLVGKVDEAWALAKQLSDQPLTERAKLEIQWEKECLKIKQGATLSPLFALVKSGKPHHRSSYLLEAFFWARCVTSQEWFTSLSKLKTLRQKKDLNFKRYAVFYRCASALDQAYDMEIPYYHRLEQGKIILTTLNELQDIDKHLLALASLIRWLVRSHNRALARLLFLEYRSLSRKLSDGEEDDALGIMSDLGSKEWIS